jgi:alpha/beta superfamily hydrolase
MEIIEKEVKFKNNFDDVEISGTLCLPTRVEKYPCVILVSGSGPQDRDQTIMGHKIFKDVAHYLSKNGITVLRFDDRGVGKSEGIFATAHLSDFKNDVLSAFYYLESHPQIDKSSIGLLGHSIGGLVASMAATELKSKLSFLVSLAAPAQKGLDLYIKQHKEISKVRGLDPINIDKMTTLNKRICHLVLNISDKAVLIEEIKKLFLEYFDKKALLSKWFNTVLFLINFHLNKTAYDIYAQAWFSDWLTTEPKGYWANVQCPVLAIGGEKDLQVSIDNLKMIENHLTESGNKNIVIKSFQNKNHLFQNAKLGLPEEYAKIKHGITTDVLDYVSRYINSIDFSKRKKHN